MENMLNLPSNVEQLPPEYSGSYFNNLDSLLQKGQQISYDRSRMDLQNAGLLNSGDGFTPAANEVLPGQVAQRKQFELPELQRSYGMGRNERLASVAFEHQREFADKEFQRRIYEMQVQANAHQALLEYKKSLQDEQSGGGFLDDFGGFGYAIPFYNATLVGSKLFGGPSGIARAAGTVGGAYLGGPVGAAAGSNVGSAAASGING